MKYVSTRGEAPVLAFHDVLLTGLASDGGLYVPDRWPQALRSEATTYAELATDVMWPFVEASFDRDRFAAIVSDAYATFDHPDVCPLVDLGDGVWLLELFHGPTLAFKDVALQLVGRLFDEVLAERGERRTVLVATSGDTGSAAIEACRGRPAVDIVVLFPEGRVSDVQRRQMTTVDEPNVHCMAVDGTFDDCQDLVKAMLGDPAGRDRLSLSAMNSINWGRVLPQVAYYHAAASALDPEHRGVTFAVPTGNFGNAYAGEVARRTGLSQARLVVATNSNDILHRFFSTGVMEVAEVVPTTSPSMDIQVSSNIERLLFEVYERHGRLLADVMTRFRVDGGFSVEPRQLDELRHDFSSTSLDDAEAAQVMLETWERTGRLIDPHTAVGLGAARAQPHRPVVALATAHPAKFPDAVEAATGERPELPARLAEQLAGQERFTRLPNDVSAVRDHLTLTLIP